MKKQKLYFAHPVNTYGQPIEIKMINLIKKFFPQFDIENPNQPQHQKGYTEWKKKCGNGMEYFYQTVLPDCEAGSVAMPFLDGMYGAGVAGEEVWYLERNLPIFLVEAPKLANIRKFTRVEKKLLLDWGRAVKETKEKEIQEKIGNSLILSIEETRKRTWGTLYKKMRKYEKAHLA